MGNGMGVMVRRVVGWLGWESLPIHLVAAIELHPDPGIMARLGNYCYLRSPGGLWDASWGVGSGRGHCAFTAFIFPTTTIPLSRETRRLPLSISLSPLLTGVQCACMGGSGVCKRWEGQEMGERTESNERFLVLFECKNCYSFYLHERRRIERVCECSVPSALG